VRRFSGWFLTGTALLVCPCHLVLTLPLLASVLVGTGLGSLLIHHSQLVYLCAGLYFVLALATGSWLLLIPRVESQRAVETAAPRSAADCQCLEGSTFHRPASQARSSYLKAGSRGHR
jgi:hypothetical protein